MHHCSVASRTRRPRTFRPRFSPWVGGLGGHKGENSALATRGAARERSIASQFHEFSNLESFGRTPFTRKSSASREGVVDADSGGRRRGEAAKEGEGCPVSRLAVARSCREAGSRKVARGQKLNNFARCYVWNLIPCNVFPGIEDSSSERHRHARPTPARTKGLRETERAGTLGPVRTRGTAVAGGGGGYKANIGTPLQTNCRASTYQLRFCAVALHSIG